MDRDRAMRILDRVVEDLKEEERKREGSRDVVERTHKKKQLRI